MSGTAGGPIFHVEPRGALGSRMFQYLVALSFQKRSRVAQQAAIRSIVPGVLSLTWWHEDWRRFARIWRRGGGQHEQQF